MERLWPIAWEFLDRPRIRKVGYVTTLALGVVAYVLAVEAGEARTGKGEFWLLVGGGTAVVIGQAIPIFLSRARGKVLASVQEIATEDLARLKVSMGSALAPALHLLGRINIERKPAERTMLIGQLVSAVLQAAQSLCGPDHPGHTRAVFYRLLRGRRRMIREDWVGRSRPARHEWADDPSDPDGRTAIDRVARGKTGFVEDVQSEGLSSTHGDHSYSTYIAVAVAAGDRPNGMLTVDSQDAGDLGDLDMEIMRVREPLRCWTRHAGPAVNYPIGRCPPPAVESNVGGR